MPGQPLPSPNRPFRCFVGLPLPESWQAGLLHATRRLAEVLSSRISWTQPGNWHLTLKFLGNVDAAQLPAVVEALRGVRFASFTLTAGQAGSFPGLGPRPGPPPRVLWLGLALGGEQCVRLAADVEQALLSLGFAPEARPFSAHLTLGRVKDAARGDDWGAVERAVAELAVTGEVWPAAGISGFVLWQSLPGAGGPQYKALAQFPARQG